MIPPIAPGQVEEQNMVGWKNTFNMRQVTLMNLAASHIGRRHSPDVPMYMKSGCITSPAKSLDILRKNLQSAINKDIDNVIKKYLEKFFQPAIVNIKANQGKNSVNDDLVKSICRQMLEEAKVMYKTCPLSRDSSPYDCSDSEASSLLDGRSVIPSTTHRKRKESDTDSETGHLINSKRHKFRNTRSTENVVYKLPVKRDGPKWNPDRINHNTLFIMGAKANKVLGFGQTRGRLYVRHPDLVRYSGDQEDKEWLSERNLMPPSGGKAYLMFLEDIQELTLTDDYKNSTNLQLQELRGFEAPLFMVNKIRAFVENVRTDKKLDLHDFQRGQSVTPTSTALDSAPSTPSDTLQALESHSKHSDINNLVHLPETSPGSNNSFMSGPLTQSPVPVTGSLLSPNMLIHFSSSEGNSLVLPDSTHNGSCISNFLAGQMSSDNSQDF